MHESVAESLDEINDHWYDVRANILSLEGHMEVETYKTFRFPILKVQLVAATRVLHKGGSEGFESLGMVILYEGTHEEHLGPRMILLSRKQYSSHLENVVLSDDGQNEIVFARILYPSSEDSQKFSEPRWEFKEVCLRRDTLLKT